MNDRVIVELKNGKLVERKLRYNAQGCKYIVYNGYRIFVECYCGRYYEVYK